MHVTTCLGNTWSLPYAVLTSLLTNLTVNNIYRKCASRILSSIRHLILLPPQVAAQLVRQVLGPVDVVARTVVCRSVVSQATL